MPSSQQRWNQQLDPTPCGIDEFANAAFRRWCQLMNEKVEQLAQQLRRITNPDGTLILDPTTLPPGSFVTVELVSNVTGSAASITQDKKLVSVLFVGGASTTTVISFVDQAVDTDVDFTGGVLKETKKTLTVIAAGAGADTTIVTFVEGCPTP